MSGKTWFSTIFGFVESDFETTRSKFRFDPESCILSSLANEKTFFVGPFECPSVKELQDRLTETPPSDLGTLITKDLIGDARALHFEKKNNGAVFMVASQFNALEMVGPGVTPEHGITDYIEDQTQVFLQEPSLGPACANPNPCTLPHRLTLANLVHPCTANAAAAGTGVRARVSGSDGLPQLPSGRVRAAPGMPRTSPD
jgi:hypothetical protein